MFVTNKDRLMYIGIVKSHGRTTITVLIIIYFKTYACVYLEEKKLA